jgi:hypothetical protein
MKRVLILMLFFAATVFSQNREGTVSAARVEPDKPTVYLSYVCQDEKNIQLRMNNNTIWHVYVEADKSYFPTKKPIQLQNGAKVYAIPNNEEIPVFYYAERDQLEDVKRIKIPKLEYHFRNGGGWLSSQDSVLFSVPIEHLRKGLKIYVEFSYEWEMSKSGDTRKEPEHRVYFRGGEIGSLNTGIEPSACQK